MKPQRLGGDAKLRSAFLVPVVLILFFIGWLPAVHAQSPSEAATRIPIERAMRVWGERYKFVTGKTVQWPANKQGALPSANDPELPPTGCFYGDDVATDPDFAAKLVQALATSMTEFIADDSRSFTLPDGTVSPYKFPVLQNFICVPASGQLDKSTGVTRVADYVFRLSNVANFTVYDPKLSDSSPFSGITAQNYLDKFYGICAVLSVTDLPIFSSNDSVVIPNCPLYVRTDGGAALASGNDPTKVPADALKIFQTDHHGNATPGGGSGPIVYIANKLDSTDKSTNTSNYSSSIIWTKGYFQADPSKYPASLVNFYFLVSDTGTNPAGASLGNTEWNPANYQTQYSTNYFTVSTTTEDGMLRSTEFDIPNLNSLTNAGIPFPQVAGVGNADEWSISCELVCYVQWQYSADSLADPDCCTSCTSGTCQPGDPNANNNSVDFSIGLGQGTEGSYGRLRIKALHPSAALATPLALIRNIDNGVHSVVDYTASVSGAVPQLTPDLVSLNSRPIKQLYSPDWVADIKIDTPNRYFLRFYHRTGLSGPSADTGLIDVSAATPFNTYTIENPGGDINHLTITSQKDDGSVKVFDYLYDPATDGWALTSGAGSDQRSESVVWKHEGLDHIQTRTIVGQDGKVVFKQENHYHTYPWNTPYSPVPSRRYELTQQIDDPDGDDRVTSYAYYTDLGLDRSNYSRLKSIVHPDSSWERYTYDAKGHIASRAMPFKDSGPDDPDSASHVFYYTDYQPVPDVDGDGQPEKLSTTVEHVLGKEVSRSYNLIYSAVVNIDSNNVTRTQSIACATPGAVWNDPNNIITETRYYAGGPDGGKVQSMLMPDGALHATAYVHNATAGTLTETDDVGQPDAALGAVVDGRRIVTVTNSFGTVVHTETRDIITNLLLDSSDSGPSDLDAYGRPLAVHYLDGLSEEMTYDCCGLESETDRAGTTTTYTYDSLKRRVTSTRAGITTLTKYDAAGRVVETVRIGRDNSQISLGRSDYAPDGRLLATHDALGRTTLYAETFEPDGTTQRSTAYPDGSQDVEVFHRDGTPFTTSGDAVHPLQFDYAVVPASQGSLSFNARVATQIRLGSNGETTEWTKAYSDMLGRTFKTEVPAFSGGGTAAALTFYNSKNQLVRTVDPDGVATLYAYDGQGRQTETAIDANGNGQIDYVGSDRIVRNAFAVVSDPDHGVVERTTTSMFFTAGANSPEVVLVQDVNAVTHRTWTTEYDRQTLVEAFYDGKGVLRQVTHAPDHTVATATQTDGYATEQKTVNAAGDVLLDQTMAYDAHGRLATLTDARDGDTTFIYFDDDQAKSTTTPAPDSTQPAQTTSYLYDARGRVSVMTAPNGAQTFQDYFPTGEVKSIHGGRQYPVAYTYDAQGRLKTLTTWQDYASRSGAAVTAWQYDPGRGVLSAKTYNDNSQVTYAYTAAGRLHTRTWARGVVTTYAYDPATGDPQGVTYSDSTPAITYAFDRAGRPAGYTDASGQCQWSYASGLLQNENYLSGLIAGLQLVRGYDAGRPSSLTVQSGPATVYQVGYGYQNAASQDTGRLSSVNSGSHQVSYGYEANSILVHTITFANNGVTRLTTTKIWDHLDRLVSITNTPSAASALSFAYQYNNANQRVKATRENGEYWQYSYDSLGQVTSGAKYLPSNAPIPGYAFGYTFNDIGDRKTGVTNGRSASYQTNLLNQCTQRDVPPAFDVLGEARSDATVTVSQLPTVRTPKDANSSYFYVPFPAPNPGKYSPDIRSHLAGPPEQVFDDQRVAYQAANPEQFQYDADGNLTDDWHWHYTWDGENHLVTMETQPSAASAGVPRQKLEFVYDAQGRRTEKKVSNWNGGAYVPAVDLRFIYHGRNLIAEFSMQNSTMSFGRAYVWGLDLSGTLQGAGGIGGLLAISNGTPTYAPAYDGNGNVMKLTSLADGSDAADFEYDVFGNVTKATGPALSVQPFGFSTKYADTETGLCYYGQRYYQSIIGRWLSMDPLGLNGGANLYGMVGNDPVNDFDELGLFAGQYHESITRNALRGVALGARCLNTIVTADVGQDDGAVAGYFTHNGPFFNPLNHGDNNQIAETIRLMRQRMDAVLHNQCADCKQADSALQTVGMIFHALQDLYAHSTYVETFGQDTTIPPGVPLWNMWNADGTPNVPNGVISGTYQYPRDNAPGPNTHRHLNKDEPDSERGRQLNNRGLSYFRLAEDAATRATTAAWNGLWNQLSAEQQRKLTQCCNENTR